MISMIYHKKLIEIILNKLISKVNIYINLKISTNLYLLADIYYYLINKKKQNHILLINI